MIGDLSLPLAFFLSVSLDSIRTRIDVYLQADLWYIMVYIYMYKHSREKERERETETQSDVLFLLCMCIDIICVYMHMQTPHHG